MSDFTTNLLATIRAKESQDNYDIFAGDKATANRGLTGRSINDVLRIQGTKAAGAYQFKPKTLKMLMADLNLTGKEKFTPELQDQLATRLLERRGLNQYLSGEIDMPRFGLNVSKEWASLPVLEATMGHKGREVLPGMSFYHGFGSNKALFNPNEFEGYKTLLASARPAPEVVPAKGILSQAADAIYAPVQAASDYLSDVFWNPRKMFGRTTD